MTYNVVKAAEISLTKSLAQQLAGIDPRGRRRPRVDSLRGWLVVEASAGGYPRAIVDFIARELPFGRFGAPEEVGSVVAFLASSKASWVSGTTVVVDGCQSRMF